MRIGPTKQGFGNRQPETGIPDPDPGYAETGNGIRESELRTLCGKVFDAQNPDGKRVLFIIPDSTRTCPMDLFFPVLYGLVADRVSALDFLVALGTHPPMNDPAIYRMVGIRDAADHRSRFPRARFHNHEWRNPDTLRLVGTITAKEMAVLSEGLMNDPVRVLINRMVVDCDLAVVVGPVFPHEVAGFSGGNKYFFPGVAGHEIIDTFHWLGALITNSGIIGNRDTPVRRVIDRAASLLPVHKLCLAAVVDGPVLRGLFAGTPEQAFGQAADLSERIHIVYKERPFQRVLSCAPDMYDDLWTAGKCMYKLEPVVGDGGELVIYAPHVKQVSAVHGETLERIGYHVRDYFVNQFDRFRGVPGGVMAHSTHVKGAGAFENGVERPRIRVTLATGIPESVCRRIGLGYMDWRDIRFEEWRDRENEGILFVPRAGEVLFRLRKGQ